MLPELDVGLAIEPYAQKEPRRCSGTEKPGVRAFADFVVGRLGGLDLGIVRGGCVVATSEHHEGRAWDWGIVAADPGQRAKAEAFIDWLLKTDRYGNEHANLRRAGIRYLIWDGRIWSTGTREWRPYSGKDDHSTHIHMTLSHDGAFGRTSMYPWIAAGAPAASIMKPWQWAMAVLMVSGAAWYALRR